MFYTGHMGDTFATKEFSVLSASTARTKWVDSREHPQGTYNS